MASNNKGWLYANDGDATLVFVHGVLSDNRAAWRYEGENGAAPVHWPELIRADARFGDISIFLAGYHTAIDAGPYGIRHCAREVFDRLNVTDSKQRRPVIEKNKITFVCHSLGGIVTRYLLTDQYAAFAAKRVGLFLIASPSGGSRYGQALEGICELYRHQQGRELAWKSWALDDLDARFRTMLNEHRIPNLSGIELCEHHGPLRFKRLRWLPFRLPPIVGPESAGRYFELITIPESDHSSICKPRDADDDVHIQLFKFLDTHDLLPGNADVGEGPPDPLEEYETAQSIEVIDGLIAWLKDGAAAGREDAFDAIHSAIQETGKYVADRRQGRKRSRQTEKRLSDLWMAVASQMQKHDPMLANLCLRKGHGWADERVWDTAEFRERPLELVRLIELAIARRTSPDDQRAAASPPVTTNPVSRTTELAKQVRRITDEASSAIVDTAVRRKLDIPHGTLNEDDYARVTDLDLSSTAISDLAPLRRLTRLTTLDLSRCASLRDLTPLADLPQLRILSLAGDTSVHALHPLENHKQLIGLNLENCSGISHLGPLAGLRSLESLQLSGVTWLRTLEPLARMDALRFLAIDRCPHIAELGPLERLESLRELYLQNSAAIRDLTPLAYLRKLEALDLSGCAAISDIAPLALLANLSYVGLRECPAITDFSALAGLTKLPVLNLNDCSRLSDLRPIGALSSLRMLYLCRCTAITDLDPLRRLDKLTSLALNGCTGIRDLAPIAALPSLRELDITGCCEITALPDALRANPNLEISGREEPARQSGIRDDIDEAG